MPGVANGIVGALVRRPLVGRMLEPIAAFGGSSWECRRRSSHRSAPTAPHDPKNIKYFINSDTHNTTILYAVQDTRWRVVPVWVPIIL